MAFDTADPTRPVRLTDAVVVVHESKSAIREVVRSAGEDSLPRSSNGTQPDLRTRLVDRHEAVAHEGGRLGRRLGDRGDRGDRHAPGCIHIGSSGRSSREPLGHEQGNYHARLPRRAREC